MTIQELLAHLDDVEAKRAELGLDLNTVVLVTTRTSPPGGLQVRLFGTRGPLGETLNIQHNPEQGARAYNVTGCWPIASIRAWVRKNFPEALDD